MNNHWMILSACAMAGLVAAGPCKREKKTVDDTKPLAAVITGFDERGCPCCGGLMISFLPDPKPYRDKFYLMENDAAEFGITSGTVFPLKVKVHYTVLQKCNGTYIHIKQLNRQ